MKITLPAEPVDLYEIKWYYLDDYSCRVIEGRLVYHVNRSWAEVYPDRAEERGRPFMDQWQIFRDGYCEGRLPHWGSPEFYPPITEDGHATREEALAQARATIEERIARLRGEITEYERRLTSGDLAP